MTRINVGINPVDLSDKHLLAEHREIKRIPNAVKKGNINLFNLPKDFSLGKGHVRFFYDKLCYLKSRYALLFEECKKRGFNVQNYESAWSNIPVSYFGNYIENDKDTLLIKQRIASKLENKFGNDTPDDGIDWEQVRMESIEADYERDEDDEM